MRLKLTKSLHFATIIGCMKHTILLVEDEITQRMVNSRLIKNKLGMDVVEASSGKQAIDFIEKDLHHDIDAVLLDIYMPGVDGYGALEAIKEMRPALPIIMLTASEDIGSVVKAIKMGALDFLTKPVTPERLNISIQNALKINGLSQEVSRLRKIDGNILTFSDLIGHDSGLLNVVNKAKKGAASDIPIMINGETGVGKELFARAIHGESNRKGAPFIAINCAAIPEKLIESTLFGHEKGAFTGAISKALGKFREAEGGTLFLDEVGELPLNAQAKLLRALQQKEIEPVGAGKPLKVNVRIISATNRNLANDVANGKFRDDLLFRLNVLPIEIPALRLRQNDIMPLANYFINKFAIAEDRDSMQLADDAEETLKNYNWPGNVRELENTIFRSVVLSDSEFIDDKALKESFDFSVDAYISEMIDDEFLLNAELKDVNLSITDVDGNIRSFDDLQNDIFQIAVEKNQNNVAKAALALGIAKSTIYRNFKKTA